MSDEAAVRIDVWLWAARLFRTRGLAKRAVTGGKVAVNGQPCKAAKALHAGDRVRVTRGEERLDLEVLGLAEMRGPAAVAQSLYRETEASRVAREAAREHARLMALGHARPPTRPDSAARRALVKLKRPD